jgi:hypothetical protein
MKVCKCCGLPESSHHEFEPQMPDGCICDPGEWGDNVRQPCHEYVGDGVSYCATCEHDKECHQVPGKEPQE